MSADAQVAVQSHGVGLDRASPIKRIFTFWVPLIAFIVITLFPFYWMLSHR